MKIILTLFAATLFLFGTTVVLCQTQYIVEIPGTKTYIFRYDNNSYATSTGQLRVGKGIGGNYRSYIYWSNILSYVPYGSLVTNVEFDIIWFQPESVQIEFRDFQFYSGDVEANYASIGSSTL